MRLRKQVQHVLQTKGFFHAFERMCQIIYRFSRGRKRFDSMTDVLEKDLANVPMTFCAAASLLERHLEAFQRLRRLGHEMAVHGFYHSRMDFLEKSSQAEILEQGHRAFQEAGFEVSGFRCPYLNYNQDTLAVLQASPYDWTSQDIVFWTNGINPGIARLKSLYQASYSTDRLSVPFARGRILEIPITAPDDEMLMERLRIRDPDQIKKVWLEVFSKVYEQGELCHLLFHPERFPEIVRGLQSVVDEAKKAAPKVWLASLSEISSWWRKRSEVRPECRPVPGGAGWRLTGRLPEGATMLLKQPGGSDAGAVYKDYHAAPAEKAGTESLFTVAAGRKPTVWLPNSCPAEIADFIRSEGFVVDRSERPAEQAMQLQPEFCASDVDRRSLLEHIDSCPHPLFRLWRWPRGARGALTISADVDSITLSDFWLRVLHF